MNAPALPFLESSFVLAFGAVSGALACYAVATSSWLQLRASNYCESIDAPLRRMLLPARGRVTLSLQITLILLLLCCAAALRSASLLLVALLVTLLPRLAILQLQKRRRAQIEAQLDVFALALANATRATPSVGRALHMLQTSLATPLDAEVAQVLRELRVGSSLEQALLNFSWRVQSGSLDALLSNVLVALRVGGNLPEVLETTASTLREMARLDGILRAKTAPARIQLWVLCCLPVGLVFAFNAVSPGYFRPFSSSGLGIALLVVAMLFWIAAVLLARKILAVEL
jgi:tight adherence protein B